MMTNKDFEKLCKNICFSFQEWSLHISKRIVNFFINALMLFTKLSKLLANVSIYIAPYVMLFIGQSIGVSRGRISVGGELFIPLYFFLLQITFNDISDVTNSKCNVPTPVQRFTKRDDDEVSIEKVRVQELLVYVADLEDWFERNDMM